MKINPITRAELEQAKNSYQAKKKNPFGLTKDDLIDDLEGFPMGVVVRMLEETKRQGHDPDIKLFQHHRTAGDSKAGFIWANSLYGGQMRKDDFWRNIIGDKNFDLFYEEYPEYRIYDLD